MNQGKTKPLSIFIPLLSLGSWFVIAVMAVLNPSGTVPMESLSLFGVALLAMGAICSWLLPYWSITRKSRGDFLSALLIGMIALIGLAWGGASVVHRDFFSFPSQVIMIYLTIGVYKIDELDVIRQKREVYPHIFTGAMVIFVLWIGWLMIMAYAIVVRQEPRWIESSVYNLFNGVIGITLVIAAATLKNRSKHSLKLLQDGIYLDDRNISKLLSPQENRIVSAFISAPSHTLTCQTLRARLNKTNDAANEDPARIGPLDECERCIAENWTAYDCATYRNLKNRINDTKKYLELLQIGTIVPSEENRREIKITGWRFRLFDDVRLIRG